jgi:hypothetical protein
MILCGSIAHAEDLNQFWLAAQHDWGAQRGFFFVVNAPFAPNQPSKLDDATLIIGVGDAKTWQFISGKKPWKFDTTYAAKAVINNGVAELWIDGERVASQPAKLAPASVDLAFNQQPSFLQGPSTYAVHQTKLIAKGTGDPVQPALAQQSKLPAQLLMFDPAADGARMPLTVTDSVNVEVAFSFVKPTGSARDLAPFIDRYGQSIQADWPGKVRSDDELKQADAVEAKQFAQWQDSTGFDEYGGVRGATWSQKPSGFFAVSKHDRKWWLVSPAGNPCFYVGLCDAPALDWEATPTDGREFLFEWLPPKDGAFAPAWRTNPWSVPGQEHSNYLAPHTVNLIRKYGSSFGSQASASTVRRAKMLGFSGFAKWSTAGAGVADLPVLNHAEIPNLARHPDIFDPAIQSRFKDVLRRQIEPRKNDPWLLGWSVGNEYDECIAAADIQKILTMGDDVPAKKALLEFAKGDLSQPPTAEQIEKLRCFYADRYYDFIYRTVKSIDPNHLYFGMWVTPNWWVNKADWASIAPHCDVIGYDYYSTKFEGDPTAGLIAANDKPVLCGEFSFPPHYGGTRGFGRYPVSTPDEKTAGQLYTQWMRDAAKNDRCVGVCYFQYRDQPLTGRGPANGSDALVQGEHFAFGLVDVTDRLKWDFVTQVRAANLGAAKLRLGSGD